MIEINFSKKISFKFGILTLMFPSKFVLYVCLFVFLSLFGEFGGVADSGLSVNLFQSV